MGIISWIIFGALAGWVASLIMGNSGDRRGCLGNIILGVIGAFVGGLVVELLTGRNFFFVWNWRSFGVAVLGAVAVLALFSPRRRRRR